MKYIGNTGNVINWQRVVDNLATMTPAHTGPDNSLGDESIVDGFKIEKLWKDAGVKSVSAGGSNQWDMFVINNHFDKSIVDKFCNFVNADVTHCWISRLEPGNMAHWHWDTSSISQQSEFDKIPNIVRYCCFISKPQPGHVFMIEDHCFYNQEQGAVWQWPSRTSWHAGTNFGFENKYLFNFFGPAR